MSLNEITLGVSLDKEEVQGLNTISLRGLGDKKQQWRWRKNCQGSRKKIWRMGSPGSQVKKFPAGKEGSTGLKAGGGSRAGWGLSFNWPWDLTTWKSLVTLSKAILWNGRRKPAEKAMAPHSSTLAWKSHGRRSLVGCSPWGREKSDTTERLPFDFSLSCIGEGNGNPLQCSCLESPRDGGAWWAAVFGVAQSRTRLKQLSSSSSSRRKPELSGVKRKWEITGWQGMGTTL